MDTYTPITTLVVGLGRSGWDIHIKEIGANPPFKVAAVVDAVEERRREAEEKYGCRAFATLEGGLKAGLAELAVICTRSVDHCPHALAALRAGCHVVVESPGAMSLRELDAMTAAARKAKRLLTFYQTQRSEKCVQFAREVMDSGILGKVFWVRLAALRFRRRYDWQTMKRFGGGLLYNAGSEFIDVALSLLESPVKEAWGYLNHTISAGDAEDFMKLEIIGKNGRLVEIERVDGCALGKEELLVCGTAGAMRIRGDKATISYFDPKLAPPPKLEAGTPHDRDFFRRDRVPWREKTLAVERKEPAADSYEALYESIRNGKRLLVTPESLRQTMRVIDFIRKRAGRPRAKKG